MRVKSNQKNSKKTSLPQVIMKPLGNTWNSMGNFHLSSVTADEELSNIIEKDMERFSDVWRKLAAK